MYACTHTHIMYCTYIFQSNFCKQLFVMMHVCVSVSVSVPMSVSVCLCVCVCVIVKALLPVLYEIKARGTRPRWQI